PCILVRDAGRTRRDKGALRSMLVPCSGLEVTWICPPWRAARCRMLRNPWPRSAVVIRRFSVHAHSPNGARASFLHSFGDIDQPSNHWYLGSRLRIYIFGLRLKSMLSKSDNHSPKGILYPSIVHDSHFPLPSRARISLRKRE